MNILSRRIRRKQNDDRHYIERPTQNANFKRIKNTLLFDSSSLACCFLLCSLVGCSKGDFPIVGLDKNGQAIDAYIDEENYEIKLHQMLMDTHQSVIPILDARSTDFKKWELQLAVVGFGVRASAGFGPFQLGVSPGIRAFFTNQKNPPPLP